jgi:putative hemolysin
MEPNPSSSLFTSIGLIAALIVLGAIFVAAEIALVSLRESQIKQIASRGKRGAKVASVASNPNRLLATLQVGVTVTGFLSAALGADRLGDHFIPWLESRGLSNDSASTASLIGLTFIIAYFSLVFGELVPKRVALYRTEQIAMYSAGFIDVVAKIFRPSSGSYRTPQVLSCASLVLIPKSSARRFLKKSSLT